MGKNTPKLRIKFIAGAFNKDLERSGMQQSQNYTKHVAQMNKTAQTLDRYDEFATLSLTPSDFAKKDGVYGIDKIKQLHTGDERLLPHQVAATLAFLKELRGFGLLADVVGSGKTYEACSVLSELSAKGKINSALLIVPAQVYETWINVLEMQFGLGKDVLIRMGDILDQDKLEKKKNGMLHPVGPIIVTTEDFVKWKETQVENVLFDVVVVDEAHRLCVEEGPSAKALKLLSVMMSTKKKAKKTYCVLLSATPHAGNLEHMFRLWYFIRCKGGTPEDFDVKTDADRTDGYRKEKEYYKQHICHGAATVMEFIDNVKISEVTQNFVIKFEEYLNSVKITNFNERLIGEQKRIIEDFLDQNEEVRYRVIDNIANAYHNGVLRSIMIRQPNDRIRKSKRVENYFFFPAFEQKEKFKIKGLKEETLYFYPQNLDTDKAIETAGGDCYSVEEYIANAKGNMTFKAAYASLYFDNRILKAFGLVDESFKKANSLGFYWEQLRSGIARKVASVNTTEEDVHLSFLPVYSEKNCPKDAYAKQIYQSKYQKLTQLLDKHKNQRVLIFFDYDIKKEERCFNQVLDSLCENPKYKKRIIVGDNVNLEKIETRFNATEDAILVVTDRALTEGANLQKCNIIVNFQVTPNPLAMEQRIGRIFRLGQENDVTIYSFADMTALEGYVLVYFNRIGLMTSNDGDAAIIAGCNTDNMVTIRCEACGNVKLMSKDDYEAYKKNDSDEIYCSDNEECRQESARGKLMQEINSNEEKCDNCQNVISRQDSDDGGKFHCMSTNESESGVMCNTGVKGDRTLYCRKICAISHCKRFLTGSMAGKCVALKHYQQNPLASDNELAELCDNCKYSETCLKKCKIGCFEEAIKGCSTCSESNCQPKPHVINFNENWEAECPICGKSGTLRPVVARTFETYIRSAFDYQQDGGKSFCYNFSRECQKVSQIKEILSNDKARDKND